MIYAEVPTDAEVANTLQELGGHATARALCDALVARNHPRRDSQLAIQRASERGRITVNPDWTLSVAVEAVAA